MTLVQNLHCHDHRPVDCVGECIQRCFRAAMMKRAERSREAEQRSRVTFRRETFLLRGIASGGALPFIALLLAGVVLVVLPAVLLPIEALPIDFLSYEILAAGGLLDDALSAALPMEALSLEA